MKQLGYALLGIGFLVGSFFVVETAESVRWAPFGAAALCMAVGLVLVRVKPVDAGEGETAGNLDALERSLDSLIASVGQVRSEQESLYVYDVHDRLDADLAGDIASFVEVRETLKERFDLQTYADVMSAFALGERHINRSWSASADGYVDEVWRCLEIAEQDLVKARQLLDAAKAR